MHGVPRPRILAEAAANGLSAVGLVLRAYRANLVNLRLTRQLSRPRRRRGINVPFAQCPFGVVHRFVVEHDGRGRRLPSETP